MTVVHGSIRNACAPSPLPKSTPLAFQAWQELLVEIYAIFMDGMGLDEQVAAETLARVRDLVGREDFAGALPSASAREPPRSQFVRYSSSSSDSTDDVQVFNEIFAVGSTSRGGGFYEGAAPSSQAEIVSREELPSIVALATDSSKLEVVQQTFEILKPRALDLVADICARLHEAHPELAPPFNQVNLKSLHMKLTDTLVLVMANLRDSESLINILYDLGREHMSHGATPEVSNIAVHAQMIQYISSVFEVGLQAIRGMCC